MKYHLHVHSLITFGGVDKAGKWYWPKRKNKLAGYRDICKTFRGVFIEMVRQSNVKGELKSTVGIESKLEVLEKKRWNVSNSRPTIELNVLQNYLARYINRIAISRSRFEYLAEQKEVNLIYKNYREQQTGKPAPLEVKTMQPLVAMDQFLQHILPPYFQKSRYYGLHASATLKKYKDKIDKKLLNNGDSIGHLFALLKALIKSAPYSCEKCQSQSYEIKNVRKDSNWIFYFITLPKLRGPPLYKSHIKVAL